MTGKRQRAGPERNRQTWRETHREMEGVGEARQGKGGRTDGQRETEGTVRQWVDRDNTARKGWDSGWRREMAQKTVTWTDTGWGAQTGSRRETQTDRARKNREAGRRKRGENSVGRGGRREEIGVGWGGGGSRREREGGSGTIQTQKKKK